VTGHNHAKNHIVYILWDPQPLTIEVEPIYLKKVFTLIELGPLQKWAVKPIDNKSDNTLKRVSDNTLKKGE
jgi:hypothetical protein